MKQLTQLALSFVFLLPAAYADNSRFQKVLKNNDEAYQLYCELNDKTNFISRIRALGTTQFKLNSYLFRKFQLNTKSGIKEFSLQVHENNGSSYYQAVIDQTKLNGKVVEGVTSHQKKQMQFSHELLGKVTCFAEFAYEPNYPLSDGQYHINVHPHNYYDYRGFTSRGTNHLYENSAYKSLMLLEDFSWKENSVRLVNFLRTGRTGLNHRDPGTIMVDVPASADVKVSAAGHNRYQMDASQNISVTYTGGNHNYCIWNNIRRLLNSLMETESNPVLDIIFKQDSIVVQKAGILGGGMSFSGSDIRRSNLLADLMQNQSVAQNYHAAYFNYFARTYFWPFSHRYASVTLNYQAPQYKNQVVLKGTGTRHIKVNFRYQ